MSFGSVPEVIIRNYILSYLDISEYFNLGCVSQFFSKEISILSNSNNIRFMLKKYEQRKINWFAEQVSRLPTQVLPFEHHMPLYIYLSDKYHQTNYAKKLQIKVDIYKNSNSIYNNNNQDNRRKRLIRKFSEEISFDIKNSLQKIKRK